MINIKKTNKTQTLCLTKKCKPWIRKTGKKRDIKKIKLLKELNEKINLVKNIYTLKCAPGDPFLKSNASKCKQLNEKLNSIEELIEKIRNPVFSKLEDCKNKFCNEGCRDSIFENGPPNKLSKGYKKFIGTNKDMIKRITEKRKKIFNNKSSVLKNNFYTGISTKNINKLKKEGAISGCVTDDFLTNN